VVGLAGFVVLYAALRTVTGSVRNAQTLEPLPPSLDTSLNLMRASLFEQFWMYGSMVAVIVALEHYRQSRRRELREADLKRQVAEYRLQVLRLQLHPHFLFNALNGIATLMLRDVRTAREMLLRLGDLLRIALTHSADHETSLREEVEFVRAYLDLERMRFGERLAVHLAIEPDSLDARVPYMILQPLVENAIRHGIAEVRAGGTLSLLTACRDGRLHIRIVNDGPRREPAPDERRREAPAMETPTPEEPRGPGIGLMNARARLSQLYGDAYRLRLVDRPQGGAELHLEIPLQSEAAA
jgi:LytS/YehU family sensor histidine kinase